MSDVISSKTIGDRLNALAHMPRAELEKYCYGLEQQIASAAETTARRIGPDTPNNDMVICPHCTSQFVAIPVNVQGELSRLRKFADQFPDEPDDPPCEHRNRSPGADYNEWCDDCGGMLPASPSKTSGEPT